MENILPWEFFFFFGDAYFENTVFPSKYTRRTRKIKVVIHAYVYKNYTLDHGLIL